MKFRGKSRLVKVANYILPLALFMNSCSNSIEGTYVNECTGETITLNQGEFQYNCKCNSNTFEIEGKYDLTSGTIYFEGAIRACETPELIILGVQLERPIFSSLKFSLQHPDDVNKCYFIKQ